MSAVSPSNILIKSLWPSEVPFVAYKSFIFLSKSLRDTPEAKSLGISVIKESFILSKKSYIVLSTSA